MTYRQSIIKLIIPSDRRLYQYDSYQTKNIILIYYRPTNVVSDWTTNKILAENSGLQTKIATVKTFAVPNRQHFITLRIVTDKGYRLFDIHTGLTGTWSLSADYTFEYSFCRELYRDFRGTVGSRYAHRHTNTGERGLTPITGQAGPLTCNHDSCSPLHWVF